MDLQQSHSGQWWKVLVITGGLVIVAAIYAKYVAAFLIGLCILLVGFGEWINHPLMFDVIGGEPVSSFPRSDKWPGMVIDTVGISILALGLWAVFQKSC